MPPIEMVAVIATRGRGHLLKTLASLENAGVSSILKRVIVVENGPEKLLENVLKDRSIAVAEYFHFEEANKSAALNFVLTKISEDPLVIFFDDDVLLDVRCLTAYADAVKSFGRGHFFGGKTGALYEEEPPPWLKMYLPVSATGLSYNVSGAGPVDKGSAKRGWFLGFNWAAFRSDLLQAKGFDPRYGPGSYSHATGQETNMQRRLKDAGIAPIYVPEAVVTHWVPKKQCTWEWALNRRRRNGIETALCSAGVKIMFKHTWMYFRAFLKLLILKISLKKNKDQILAVSRFDWAYTKGIMDGYLWKLTH